MEDSYIKSISDIRSDLRAGKYSCRDLVGHSLNMISKLDQKVGAMIYCDEDEVIDQAEKIDEKIKGGDEGKLLGIPIILKDNMVTKDMPSTSGSKILQDYRSVYDATIVEKLKNSGAIILGKSNMDEFAMGSSCENSYYKKTKNPWDLSRVPGGSSGGSAAAVAAGYCNISLGSDTGGSIRQPASLCGVLGLKPTYGRVSRYGLMSLASSFDQIGLFARRVEDVALVLEVISGLDKNDSTSSDVPVDQYSDLAGSVVNGRKVAIVKELCEGVSDSIKKLFDQAVSDMEKMGLVVEEVSMPILTHSIPVYYILMSSECSTNLARYDGVRYGYNVLQEEGVGGEVDVYQQTRAEGFGDEVKRRIMLGTYSLSSGYYDDYFGKAARVRTLIIDEFRKNFQKYDYLLGLTSPFTAFGLGEKVDDPLSMYLSDVMTVSMNLAGVPAVSVPIGWENNLPVGMQLVGKWFKEKDLLELAYHYEGVKRWYTKKPGILEGAL